MSKIIRNMSDLQAVIDSACEKAVENSAITVMNKLQDYIEIQYYKDSGFYPNVYERTYEFFNHVAYDLLSSNKAQIYVDIEGMHYKNDFSPWQVVKWASESKHGADYYKTDTDDFWSVFIEWCNNNLMELLKMNLQKQGIKIK